MVRVVEGVEATSLDGGVDEAVEGEDEDDVASVDGDGVDMLIKVEWMQAKL